MAAVLMDGAALAKTVRQSLTERAARLTRAPRMVMVLVGEDAASQTYLARKAKDAAEIGADAQILSLPASISPKALLSEVARLNADPEVTGFFVQFPLPLGHDAAAVSAAIAPQKDIDGLSPQSLGLMLAGMPGLRPATPSGILALLQHAQVPLAGRRVLVVGRGALIGRPLAVMLSAPGVDAVVTQAHRRAKDLAGLCQSADVILSATGVPGLIRPEMIRPGAAVIGAGIGVDSAGQVRSDIAAKVEDVAGYLSADPSSIGALTRAMLLRNLVAAAEAQEAAAR